jgi:hypothetical protein
MVAALLRTARFMTVYLHFPDNSVALTGLNSVSQNQSQGVACSSSVQMQWRDQAGVYALGFHCPDLSLFPTEM